MLKLLDIVKEYGEEENKVKALKGVSLEFRKNEFVSILGQSGCGKTTLLNIVGGLDRYTSGDLIIDDVSTKNYRDVDWDLYRNLRVGFIFQSYNLISHISILANVEMSLTLSGVNKKERVARAKKALEDVGLGDQIKKKPNQLSGGQMQRVSIARALVNNPGIILADEPTGALDTETSVQIMDILKEISNDRLIIMVTHNAEIAEKYSTRIIRLNDGEVVGDSNPFVSKDSRDVRVDCAADKNDIKSSPDMSSQESQSNDEKIAVNASIKSQKDNKIKLSKQEKAAQRALNASKKKSLKKTSMKITTALSLSFNNLMTKKGRTFMTAFAGSIGIIGVALVLAISNGFSAYITTMQTDMLANYPITVASQDMDANKMMNIMMGGAGGATSGNSNKFPNIPSLSPKDPTELLKDAQINNNITQEYVDFIEKMRVMDGVSSIRYSYNVDMNVIGEINKSYPSYAYSGKYTKVNNTPSMQESMGGIMGGTPGMPASVNINWQEMAGDKDFVLSQFDMLAGQFPTNKNQLVLVVNDSNKVNQSILAAMNLPYAMEEQINFDKIVGANGESGVSFKLVMNNEYYQKIESDDNKKFKTNSAEALFKSDNEKIEKLDVVCVLRPKNNDKIKTLDMGIAYSNELTKHVLASAAESDIAKEQALNHNINVLTGEPMGADQKTNLEKLGVLTVPSAISIFPTDFNAKEQLKSHLDSWNEGKEEVNQIRFTDMSQTMTEFMGKTVDIISIVLICFAAVSLVVSSIMIGIITYVSVVERTKEIGILRSMGARKFDISNVFNAETSIIGFIAGLIGVLITYILSIPVNVIVKAKLSVASICVLNPWHALLLIVLSVGLTIIAGLIPSRIAAKRDPVVALRTD